MKRLQCEQLKLKGKMVIEFDPEIFQDIEKRQKLTHLLYLCYFDRRYDFFIDLTQINTSPIYIALNSEDKSLIEEYFNRFVNDSIDIDHLITNQSGAETFDLDEARLYFDQPLLIILENSLHDKYFLESVANNFSKRGKAVRRNLQYRWISIINAGGCENVDNVISEKLTTYLGLSKSPERYLRCFVIVDSDSTYPGEITPSRITLKEFLDSKSVKHHILLKREMENYLPDEVFSEVQNNDEYIASYQKLSPLQKDYFDLENGFTKNLSSYNNGVQDLYLDVSEVDMGNLRKGGLKMTNFKANFPKLFLSEKVTQENLKKRTEHQGELANELEIILDKINDLL